MTDNEIIKALERCSDGSGTGLIQATIDLINRQKAELDDLKRDDLPRCKDALRRANEIGMAVDKENQELRAEIERLKNNPTLPKSGFINLLCGAFIYTETLEQYNKFRRKFKAEAIKEFAERLKSVVAIHNGDMWSKCEYIDNLVKEMVGEDK